MQTPPTIQSDWQLLMTFLPEGWRDQARLLGALKRPAKYPKIEDVLRVLLLHLAEGISLRETVVRAELGGLPRLSNVALYKRLRAGSEWFRWMGERLLERRGVLFDPPSWLAGYRVRSVDASVITEPGSTGSDWLLHYSLNLFSLRCEAFLLTDVKTGESFKNFAVCSGDLLIGDRGYGHLAGMRYVKEKQGEFLVRLRHRAFGMTTENGTPLSLLEELRPLQIGHTWERTVTGGGNPSTALTFRLCVLRKSDQEADKAIKVYRSEQSKKQRPIHTETEEMHRYILLATSLPSTISTVQVLELYRRRWQIELAFKRLKGILGMGHLPKKDIQSCKAWLHGKLLVALLVQAALDEGRDFSPWGYPLRGGV